MFVKKWKTLVVATLILLLLTPWSGTVSAAEVTVSSGGNIQAALDQVGNAGGGTVYLNSGTYTVSDTVFIPNNTTLKGQGTTRPIIKLAIGLNIPVIANKSLPFQQVKVEYLEVDGSVTLQEMQGKTKGNVNGIQFTDRHNNNIQNYGATIIDSIVKNAAMGILIGRTDGVDIIDTNISYCGTMDGTLGYHNIYISTSDNVRLYRVNSSHSQTGMGIKLTDYYADQNEQSFVIDQVTADNNKDRGISTYDLSNVTIRGSYFRNNGKSGMNIIRSEGSIVNNVATGNGFQENVAYDIWFNDSPNIQQSGNTYVTKAGF